MTHVALDLSLSTTGIAYPGGSDILVCPSRLDGGRRLVWWASSLSRFIRDHWEYGLEVVSEAPIIHERNRSGAIPTIKLHGVAEVVAYNAGPGVRYCEVDNATLKAYAVRAGGAKRDGRKLPKSQMVAAAVHLGCDDPRDDNEADAYLLYCLWADRANVRGNSAPVIANARRT